MATPVFLNGGTHGEQQHPIRVADFIVSKSTHAPRLRIGTHAHERASINIVLAGVYRETCRGETGAFPPLTFIAKPPGESHGNQFGQEGARCLLIEAEAGCKNGPFAELFERPLICSAAPVASQAITLLGELHPLDPLSELSIESLTIQILIAQCRRYARSYHNEPAWMKGTLSILNSGATERISLSALAASAGVHPVHLARTFKQVHGMSIGAYARRLRINRTLELLCNSDLELSQVAVDAGYYDQSHMARLVKRATGLSPTEIRRRI